MSIKALNFGSLNLDYTYQVPHFVLPGETITAVSQTVGCGGKGLNQSIALAKAGVEVYHAGCVGRGGEMLSEKLKSCGVDLSYLRKTDTFQGNAIIQVNAEGQNNIILYGGSNRVVSDEQVRETIGAFSAGDYLILQNEINNMGLILDETEKKGLNAVLNPSPFEEYLLGLNLKAVRWLLVNEVEVKQFTGCTDPDEAWKFIHSRYPEMSVVITLGGDGAVCFSGSEKVFEPARKVKAVDTTAAGDTFTGYFIAGLIAGLSLAECMARATKASAICVTRHGAADSIPVSDEVDHFDLA